MINSIPFRKLISKRRPFFIYDGTKIFSNIAKVQKIMNSILNREVSLAFSLKTQPNYKVIQTLRDQNISLDVASLNELNYALSIGFDPVNVFLGGIGLTDLCIGTGLKLNIGGIHLNGIDLFEHAYLEKESFKSQTKLSLRFHPDYLYGSKIGESKETILNRFSKKRMLDGLHIYVGREAFDKSIIEKIFSDIGELEKAEIFKAGWTLYFGPGLPDLDQTEISLFKISHGISNIKIEVGRSIVSSAGYYAAPVLSVKQYAVERKTVIIDGGLQHFGSPWVSIKQGPAKMKGRFYDNAGKPKLGPKEPVAIYGSLCLWHDCLHPSFQVPKSLGRGDWILVPFMGAYGLTAGVPLFIGETLPLEFYFDGQRFQDVTHNSFGESTDR